MYKPQRNVPWLHLHYICDILIDRLVVDNTIIVELGHVIYKYTVYFVYLQIICSDILRLIISQERMY